MKAFRRPAEKDVLTRYTQHAFRLIQGGMNFTDAMKQVASAVPYLARFCIYMKTRTIVQVLVGWMTLN